MSTPARGSVVSVVLTVHLPRSPATLHMMPCRVVPPTVALSDRGHPAPPQPTKLFLVDSAGGCGRPGRHRTWRSRGGGRDRRETAAVPPAPRPWGRLGSGRTVPEPGR